jgi:hypothetical protein
VVAAADEEDAEADEAAELLLEMELVAMEGARAEEVRAARRRLLQVGLHRHPLELPRHLEFQQPRSSILPRTSRAARRFSLWPPRF